MIKSSSSSINIFSITGVLCFSISLSVLIYFRFPINGILGVGINSLILVVSCFVVLKMFPEKGTRTVILYSFFPLILFGFWLYVDSIFDAFDWSAIIFHLKTGFGDIKAVTIYYKMGIMCALSVFLLALGILILKNYCSVFRYLDIIGAVVLLVCNPALSSLAKDSLILDRQSNAILKYYQEPKISITEGQEPLNFVHVFLESAERTYFDEVVFGPTANPLKELEAKGFSSARLMQVRDTAWTAAGISASLCGVPLSPFGILSHSHFGITSEFLTNTTCLGDLLEQKGYDLSSIQGTDVTFAGHSNLFGKHGFQSVLGHDELLKLYPDQRHYNEEQGIYDWGHTDDLVFQAGMDTLAKAQANSKPFGIVLQTMGGHSPKGTVAPKCMRRAELQLVQISILKANFCTNLLLKEFIEEADERGLLDNTIVIVQSDHLTTNSDASSLLRARKRTNFFAIMGPNIPLEQSIKPASMMDVFPTILEALGFEVLNRRAGIGVSLFSSEPTLTSKYGVENFNGMIAEDNMLAPKLWGAQLN